MSALVPEGNSWGKTSNKAGMAIDNLDQYIYLNGVDILRRKNDGFGAYVEQGFDAKQFAERLTRVRALVEESVAYAFRYRYAYYTVLNKFADS